MKLLIVIDVEKNFINEHTKDMPSKIDSLIKNGDYNHIIFTKFINSYDSPFYKVIGYKGCISESDCKIMIDTSKYKVFEKRGYTAYTKEIKDYIKNNNIDEVYLCGIDTDQCILKTAVDMFEDNINVKVLSEYSMSHSGNDYHEYALKILKKFIGKDNVL